MSDGSKSGFGDWGAIIPFFLVVASILVSSISTYFNIGAPKLEVVASATKLAEGNGWQLSGRILDDGEDATGARVWIIASDERGNRYSPPDVKLEEGSFSLEIKREKFGADLNSTSIEVVIEAMLTKPAVDSEKKASVDSQTVLRGKDVLTLGREGGTRRVKPRVSSYGLVPILFVSSIVLALVQFRKGSLWLKVKYYSVFILALVFSACMVGHICAALYYVNANATKGEVISLGIANIYHDTYVEGVAEEWIFSLTAPPPVSTQATSVQSAVRVTHGLGAPLWVLLVSVIGATLFTIDIIVKSIKERADLTDPDEIKGPIERIVRHQFYILFSPLGAIFVYQFLVLGKSAQEPVTVAMAALAAGVVLNLLLDKALETVQGFMIK